MNKAIKKEIERNLRQPTGEYVEIIRKYKHEVRGTEKAIFLTSFFDRRNGYIATLRELNRHGYYLEQATFYRLRDCIICDIALRACYEGLICPWCDETKQ